MSQLKIYVGNLPYKTTEEDLRELFGAHGAVADVKLITERETGRSKGFAFVTFETEQGVQGALTLHGAEFGGRQLKVAVAQENPNGGGGRQRR